MSRREEYETKTQALLEPIAEANGVSVYDVEYVKEGADYHLCAYIDKPEGVNIQDCENVSRALSDALDRRISLRMPIYWRSAARDWAAP